MAIFQGKLNDERYKRLLAKYILPATKRRYHGSWFFVQDNDQNNRECTLLLDSQPSTGTTLVLKGEQGEEVTILLLCPWLACTALMSEHVWLLCPEGKADSGK